MKPLKLTLRNGYYYLRKRVPARYMTVDSRRILNVCLFTDSQAIATRKAREVWDEMIEAWEAKLAGHHVDGEQRLDAARELAHKRGFRYLDSRAVAALPLGEVLSRLRSVEDRRGGVDMKMADAALGLPKRSDLKVSQALDHFYKVADDKLIGKSEDQMRKHRNPREKAARSFIEVVGDKQLAEISSEDMWEFRQWLTTKVRKGELKAASANKDFTHLNSVWKTVAQSKGIQLAYSTEGLALTTAGEEEDTRPPFSREWITDKLLAPEALAGLNEEARLIFLGMVNTGYRPSEGAGLMQSEIRLDTNVPHIIIQPNANRTLKTPQSRRVIPLTGVSLEAFREAKKGFPRYAQNGATLSGTVNKFLRLNNLLETPEHSMYSLRHSLEDRMLEAGIDERVRRDMLGHKLNRERYGAGGDLAFLHEQITKVAF